MSLRIFLVSLVFVCFGMSAFSQIIIDNTPTPADLVTNTLIGPGLVTSNISFTGNAQQRAFFDGTGSNIGLADGVFLSSGNVTDVVPPNQPNTGTFGAPGDPDLVTIAQSVTSNPQAGLINATQDAAILEFDFVPDGDVVTFNFVFASEEYTTFINTQFNDAFGFFISGPGYAGPFTSPAAFPNGSENLALVPGTNDPITISTVYIDPNQAPLPTTMNPTYYVGTPVGHSFNGFTVPIEISFSVICDSTYHFKFAVADCVDDFLDTGVFLEGGSFQSVPVDLSLETNVSSGQWGDSIIFEGCGTAADFVFTRPSCQSGDSLWAEIGIGGNAINGVDYATIPDSVLFLPGITELTIPFFAFQDGVFEGYEDVILTVVNILPSGDTIVTVGSVWLLDELNIEAVTNDTLLLCQQDSLEISAFAINGVPPYSFVWENSPNDTLMVDTTYSAVSASSNGVFEYYITAIDACGFTDLDTLTVEINQTLSIDTVLSFPSAPCDPTGAVSAMVSGTTGVPLYEWAGPGAGSPNSINATVWEDLSSGWYYFTVMDNVCEESDSVFVDVTPPPIASFDASPQAGCAPLSVVFTNTSQNATSYEWDFGGGNVVNATSTNPISEVFTASTTVQLTAFDDGGCPSDASQTITVTLCGCADPNAENYNPSAVIDDGSCFYPEPIIEVPNIFTPNGDNQNDIFVINVENAQDLEFTILNRWGNVVYQANGLTSAWNGFIEGGNFAEDGTYFVKYTVTAINGGLYEGHGFVQLVDGSTN